MSETRTILTLIAWLTLMAAAGLAITGGVLQATHVCGSVDVDQRCLPDAAAHAVQVALYGLAITAGVLAATIGVYLKQTGPNPPR